MSRKRSLFAQRMSIANKLQNINSIEKPALTNTDIYEDRSYIVDCADAENIHKDSIQTLSKISHEEKLQERNHLLASLKPDLVEFLKSKRKKNVCLNTNTPAKQSMDITESQSTSQDSIEIHEVKNPCIGIAEVKELKNKYLHMDVVENDKLEWIGDLPLEVQPPGLNDPYPARFDFEGELLPYCDKGKGVLIGLHNHGEEPERPGYTLQELIQLTRSSVLQQRVIALNTLANIMKNASKYDKIFNEPILPALLDSNMFLLLRFSLDDPAPSIVKAAASALSNLVSNQVDENCLDLLLGTPLGLHQPSLGVVIEDMKPSDIDELKDHQLLKLDIIRGALRTDVLQRIKFILTDLEPEPFEIKQLLKLLIRIARHSFEMANSLFNCKGLLDSVRALLNVQEGSSYYPEALKLFRIIASRSHTLASAIFDKYDILQPIFTFIACKRAVGHPEAMHLALESFYTWQSFLSYNIATESVETFRPVLMWLVETHFNLTNIGGSRIDMEHGAALVSTITVVSKLNFNQARDFLPVLFQSTGKWLTQFTKSPVTKYTTSKLIGAYLTLFATIHSESDCSSAFLPLIEKILISRASRSIKKLKKSSWLIHGSIISSPDNLPSLGCVSPIVNEESTLPLIYGLAAYILASKNIKITEKFLRIPELISYIKRVLKGDNITKLSGHWYARPELHFLVVLVHLFTNVNIQEHQYVFHNLAFKLLTSIQMGDRALLPEIISKTIFNKKFLSPDIEIVSKTLKELKLNDIEQESKIKRHTLLKEALNELQDIEKFYIQELGFEGLLTAWPPVTLTGILNSTQSALPLDWPFLPIIRLYESKGSHKNIVSITRLTLKWLIIIEEMLSNDFLMDYTAKYCRLCCIYLTEGDLFHDVSDLLDVCLYYVLRHKNRIDFERPIPGLTSFYDFYRDLLEQYTGVSYGNPIFAQYIIVPLQQRHNIKYKKLFWSEMGGVLRLLRTSVEEVDIEDFLSPCETDSDLLNAYCSALGAGLLSWCPLLHRVALHHVAVYMKTNSDTVSSKLKSRIHNLANQELKSQILNYKM